MVDSLPREKSFTSFEKKSSRKTGLINAPFRDRHTDARGEAEIGFQQISELLPVPGIAHITPLPPEVQKVSTFSAGVARTTTDAAAARAVLRFLSSAAAAQAISKSGLEPIETV